MKDVSDITIIILTYNEEKHIERCIQSVNQVAAKVIVIDSFSSDQTVPFSEALGACVYQHRFINQADQFQWALDTLPIDTKWVMRIDADEYLDPHLQKEIYSLLSKIPEDVDGIYIKRKIVFLGKWIRFGGVYPHIVLRIWRTGKGRVEQRWMDEHIVLQPGSKTILAQGNLVDDNHKGITFWINKHNQYASREAVDMLNIKYPLFPKDTALTCFDDPQAKTKRKIKEKVYVKLPLGFRALLYFVFRYLFRLGFLDGNLGFVWHFMQGFWYRLLVDLKIMEIEKRCGGNVELMKDIFNKEYGIQL